MKEAAVYIKLEQSVDSLNKKVFVRDLGTVFCIDKKIEAEIKEMLFYTITAKENKKYIFSIMKVIKLIEKRYPNVLVVNLGEADFIINYIVPGKKPLPAWEWIKTGLVALTVFFGAAFSIMTFNTVKATSPVFIHSQAGNGFFPGTI